MTPPPAFDLQPALVGPSLALRPLEDSDFEALYAVARDPLLWEQHPEPTRYQRPVFEAFFAGALASGGALLVTDRQTGQAIGSSRYYDWHAEAREVAIGFTFLARSHWGGGANREMKHLMLAHAFKFARTVWFHVGKDNWRSRKAMEKIGGRLDREARKELNGVVREYVFFRIDADSFGATN